MLQATEMKKEMPVGGCLEAMNGFLNQFVDILMSPRTNHVDIEYFRLIFYHLKH
jgi:hypothetical protein